MNIVALNNRLASKVPHWHELEKLSKEDKIEVIALFPCRWQMQRK